MYRLIDKSTGEVLSQSDKLNLLQALALKYNKRGYNCIILQIVGGSVIGLAA